MGSLKEQLAIDAIIATFPDRFGLRNFPGDIFRISASNSYFTGPGECGGKVMLYTQRERDGGEWIDFAKGTESELRAQVIPGVREW